MCRRKTPRRLRRRRSAVASSSTSSGKPVWRWLTSCDRPILLPGETHRETRVGLFGHCASRGEKAAGPSLPPNDQARSRRIEFVAGLEPFRHATHQKLRLSRLGGTFHRPNPLHPSSLALRRSGGDPDPGPLPTQSAIRHAFTPSKLRARRAHPGYSPDFASHVPSVDFCN